MKLFDSSFFDRFHIGFVMKIVNKKRAISMFPI